MRLVNKSSRPTDEVRRLVRLAMKGLSVKGVTVIVVDARKRSWDGKIHATGHATTRGREVLIRIPPDDQFPFDGWRRHRSSPWNHDHACWREALVAVAAHEGKHHDIWQNNIFYPSTQRMEMACEAHQRWVMDRYRAS